MENETFSNNDLLVKNLIKQTHKVYEENSTRSNKKIIMGHSIIASDIGCKENRNLFYAGTPAGERVVEFEDGYSKKCDFSCFDENDNLLYVMETKFIFRNCMQNLNNYFEGEYGRAHILSSKVPYFSLTFCLDKTPYYKKNGEISRIENINESHFKKYNYLKKINNCFHSVSIFSFEKNKVISSVGFSYEEIINIIKGI